jgi:predicted RNase H-like nuclease (RuvC/YqgF family)
MSGRSGAIRAACYCYISLDESDFFERKEQQIEAMQRKIEHLHRELTEASEEILQLREKLSISSSIAEAEATKIAAAMLYARSIKLERMQ